MDLFDTSLDSGNLGSPKKMPPGLLMKEFEKN